MEIDKIIKREVISLVVSIVLILLIFIGVSFASFFSVAEGKENTVTFGDIDLTFCTESENDINCDGTYTNYGQTIGLTKVNGQSVPTKIYPYASSIEALSSTPYIFNIKNTGNLKLYVNAYLTEDEDFIPSGDYASYTQTTNLYANNIKVGIGVCDEGIPDLNTVDIQTFGSLIDNRILTSDELEVGEDKTYCLWTWLDENTPNSVQSTYFVANISLSGEYKPFVPSLRNTILSNNTPYADTVRSPYVNNDNGINFGQISSDSNGKGLYYTMDTSKSELGKRIYYFRGEVENNYLLFGGYCWRVIRTNENGSVRVRYGGTPTTNNGVTSCPQTGSDVYIDSSEFNNTVSDIQYMKYESCTASVCSNGTCYSESNSLCKTGDSDIKSLLETWYTSHLDSYTEKYIDDAIYCNDSKVSSADTIANISNLKSRNVVVFGGASGIFFNGAERLISTSAWEPLATAQPTFKCSNNSDKFTVESTNGNADNTKPIGLITADEIAYAGGAYSTNNSTYYLRTGQKYWTMTPLYLDDDDAKVFVFNANGGMENSIVTDTSIRVLPVISIKDTVGVAGGTGVYNNPYVLE